MKLENTIKGLIILLIYLSFMLAPYLPFQLLNINVNNIPIVLKMVYVTIVELIIIIAAIIINKDYISKSWNDFKKNKNTYLKKYIKYWFMILIGTVILNSIIIAIKGNIAGNEEGVRTLLGSYPIYMWVSGVLIAPFIEELVFRLSIRSIFNNKYIFIIVSGLLFGFAHLVGNITTATDLLYIFPYALPGFIFAYILYKSDNIFNTIWLHLMHNGILLTLELVLLLCGVPIV